MPGAVYREGFTGPRVLLAAGLMISAGLVAIVGGQWGWGIGACQGSLGIAVVHRPKSPAPLGAGALSLVAAPLAAIRHWTASLPGACHCARLPQPPPALVSSTGLVVALDLLLLGLALWQMATNRGAEVGKSSS